MLYIVCIQCVYYVIYSVYIVYFHASHVIGSVITDCRKRWRETGSMFVRSGSGQQKLRTFT